MTNDVVEEVRQFWDRTAQDWKIQVGDDGDANRRLNSDPVLWAFAGDVSGLDVLDAGCGTGYLSKKLEERGARVLGVDFSPAMIEIAQASYPGIDFRVDSVPELATIGAESFDLVAANYVLMDEPDLEGTVQALYRVLRPGGKAIVVFSHPCFPQGRRFTNADGRSGYMWDFPYFERQKCVDPPWGHFAAEFIWFHRPLSDYWKAFVSAGFTVLDFEEPRLGPGDDHPTASAEKLLNCKTRPYSVAFRLGK